ncbi:hypothetical protein DEO72_LG9g1333 [Vigna unguiculata]|uniref:Uncharacterized protein n=1 Tax=Vigna unguiculata TaxID=3917 RepID=A0A4D6N053_VIGUN|nr:hypothetical protein DEO72_LG9g1333 [Vigna unguiculata]
MTSVKVRNSNPIILLFHCFLVPSLFPELLCSVVGVRGETMARSDTLAQASLSRLGETCRNRSGLHSSSRSGESSCFERGTISLRRETLAQGLSRSGEKGSPKRAMQKPPSVHVTISPKRELGGEQLGGEQRYPPQVRASAESDLVICIRMSRVES